MNRVCSWFLWISHAVTQSVLKTSSGVNPTCSWFSWFSHAVSTCESNMQLIFMIQSCSQYLWIQHAVDFHDSVMQSVLVNPTCSQFSWFSHAISTCEFITVGTCESITAAVKPPRQKKKKKKTSRDPIHLFKTFFFWNLFLWCFCVIMTHPVSRLHFFLWNHTLFQDDFFFLPWNLSL